MKFAIDNNAESREKMIRMNSSNFCINNESRSKNSWSNAAEATHETVWGPEIN